MQTTYYSDRNLRVIEGRWVYRFEVTAPVSNVISISFGAGPSGSGIDPTPYVNAMTVTQVPEPSALSLLAVGLGGVMALRRVRRKAD